MGINPVTASSAKRKKGDKLDIVNCRLHSERLSGLSETLKKNICPGADSMPNGDLCD